MGDKVGGTDKNQKRGKIDKGARSPRSDKTAKAAKTTKTTKPAKTGKSRGAEREAGRDQGRRAQAGSAGPGRAAANAASTAPARSKAAAGPVAGDAAAEAAASEKKTGEKLHKVLARTGIGSRREMERWIEQGRVTIDGRPARLGDRVDGAAQLAIDGAPLATAPAASTRCLLYNKPTGEVCSRKDPEGRRTVFESLPRLRNGRWISIGRLDYNTSGLLLFTTDGELANALMHPSSNIEREYMVRVMGNVQDDMLQNMLDGVLLEDGLARFTDIQDGGGDGINHWFYVVIMEGRNREVRRLWESQGLTVSRLKRVRYGEIFIPSKVKKGQWVELERKEVKSLYRMAGLPFKQPEAPTEKERRQMERQLRKKPRPPRSADGGRRP